MTDKYKLLPVYLAERAAEPFVWGVNDCCVFAADWVLRVTGCDPMPAIRGKYSDEAMAKRIIGYGGSIKLMATAALGPALPTVATGQRGDIVLFETEAGPALGICVGEKFAAVPPEGGLKYFAMRHAVTAWRIE